MRATKINGAIRYLESIKLHLVHSEPVCSLRRKAVQASVIDQIPLVAKFGKAALHAKFAVFVHDVLHHHHLVYRHQLACEITEVKVHRPLHPPIFLLPPEIAGGDGQRIGLVGQSLQWKHDVFNLVNTVAVEFLIEGLEIFISN